MYSTPIIRENICLFCFFCSYKVCEFFGFLCGVVIALSPISALSPINFYSILNLWRVSRNQPMSLVLPNFPTYTSTISSPFGSTTN